MTSKKVSKSNHRNTNTNGNGNPNGNGNGLISPFASPQPGQSDDFLKHQLVELRLSETMESLRNVTAQYNNLLKDFRLLSDKYIITKQCAIETIWKYCPKHSDEFKSMPYEDKYLVESKTSIGEYSIVNSIGEGQFSTVKRCTKPMGIRDCNGHMISTVTGNGSNNSPNTNINTNTITTSIPGTNNTNRSDIVREYAVKNIVKDKIRNIEEVVRIENEISTLKLLSPHPNIIRLVCI